MIFFTSNWIISYIKGVTKYVELPHIYSQDHGERYSTIGQVWITQIDVQLGQRIFILKDVIWAITATYKPYIDSYQSTISKVDRNCRRMNTCNRCKHKRKLKNVIKIRKIYASYIYMPITK